jgi:hypothetical protein
VCSVLQSCELWGELWGFRGVSRWLRGPFGEPSPIDTGVNGRKRLSMTLDYSKVNQLLVEKVTHIGSADDSWILEHNTTDRWAHELVGRIAVLTGHDPIVYVSGYVDEINGVDRSGDGTLYDGEIAAFTSAKIVRATITLVRTGGSSDLALKGTVTAFSRADIATVSSESVVVDPSNQKVKTGSFVIRLKSGEVLALPVTGSGSVTLTPVEELVQIRRLIDLPASRVGPQRSILTPHRCHLRRRTVTRRQP